MKATVSFAEPNLVREAAIGQLFVPHVAALQECVCARISTINRAFLGGACEAAIVVIACRVSADEAGYQPTGTYQYVSPDTWITFVEPVEATAFRAPLPRDESTTTFSAILFDRVPISRT